MKTNEMGTCPVCGCENLDYGRIEADGGYVYIFWDCPDCESEGQEQYTFDTHVAVYDKDQNEITI